MTKTINKPNVAAIDAAKVNASAIKGRNASARLNAFMGIAPNAYAEACSRGDLIKSIATTIGKAPTGYTTKTVPDTPAGKAFHGAVTSCKVEVIAGRVAARLPASEFPKGMTKPVDRIDHARELVMFYAAPAESGKKARNLRVGQKGRRSVLQHKAIRSAEDYWSQLVAELDFGTAKTQATKNKAKRSTNANPKRGDGKGATPSHAELVTAPKPTSADDAVGHVVTQAAALLGFANKNAKLLPTDFGAAIQAFKSAINKAANDYEVRKAAADQNA